MLVVFPPIFVADTKITYGYNFVCGHYMFFFFYKHGVYKHIQAQVW